MPAGVASGSQLKLYMADWGPLYEAVLHILGPNGTILPLADPHHGKPDAATFTTVGGEQLTGTWADDTSWRAFDGHDALADSTTFPYRFQGIIPFVDFNGTDEHATFADAAYFTRSALPFSVGVWTNLFDATTTTFMSKFDATTGLEAREWTFQTDSSDRFRLTVYDETNDAQVGRRFNTALTENVWLHLVAVYDGGADAANIKIYLNGSRVDNSDALDDAGFVQMQDTDGIPRLASNETTAGAAGSTLNGKLAGGPLGPFFTHKLLQLDEIKALYQLGRRALWLV